MKKILLIIVLVIGVAQWWYRDPTISVPSNDVSFSYIVKYTGNGGSKDNLPMLVALHGNGDTASHFYDTALDQLHIPLRIILLKGPIPKGSGSAWPWSAADFSQYGQAVNEAINALAYKFPTKQKPVLLGFSGGAMMAYYQAVKHGDSYSYIYPVSGRLSDDLLGDDTIETGAPVFAYHGKSDSVISISGGKQAVGILQANSVPVVFTEFDGGHHGLFKDMKTKITQDLEKRIEGLL